MADDLKEQAEQRLAEAQRVVARQSRLLEAMKCPQVQLAAKLHALLCGQWCDHGYGALCYEPYRELRTTPLDGWAIAQNAVNGRYDTAARRILEAAKDVPVEQVIRIMDAVIGAKKSVDAERFKR